MQRTFKQIEKEAKRRVAEDGMPRVISTNKQGDFGICELEYLEERPITERAIAIAWRNKVEVI